MGKIYKICLTGAPCSGKTTSMDYLSERLSDKGFKVFIVPEAATLMFNAGAELKDTNYEQTKAVQTNMVRLVMALEDYFINVTKSYKREQERNKACVEAKKTTSEYKGNLQIKNWLKLGEKSPMDGHKNRYINFPTLSQKNLNILLLDVWKK